VIHVLILALYKLFVCLLNFLPPFFQSLLSFSLCFLSYLFTSLLVCFLTYLSVPSEIDPFRFQAIGRKTTEATKPGLSFLCLLYVVVYFVVDACLLSLSQI